MLKSKGLVNMTSITYPHTESPVPTHSEVKRWFSNYFKSSEEGQQKTLFNEKTEIHFGQKKRLFSKPALQYLSKNMLKVVK